jgi:Rrf2 family protein
VLARLQEAGLVRSQTGVAGGATLARAARRISLLDVYRAVDEGSIFCMHSPNPRCPIGSRIPVVLGSFLPKVEEAMEGALKRVSIHKVARAVLPGFPIPKRRKANP